MTDGGKVWFFFKVIYTVHLVYFRGTIFFFICLWKKLDINFKKISKWLANFLESHSHICSASGKEEGRDRSLLLSWVSSNTGLAQGWREKATSKKEYVIKWGIYHTPSEEHQVGNMFYKLNLGSDCGITPFSLSADPWLMNFFKKWLNKNKSLPHTPPLPQKDKNLDIPAYSPKWNAGTALTTWIRLLQRHHKYALLLNKNKIVFSETVKQKLVLITFLTMRSSSELTNSEPGKGPYLSTGFVSQECVWLSVDHVSLLQKQIIIFDF